MGWWSSLFKTRAKDWVFAPLTSAQVPDGLGREDVRPDGAYLSVFLQSMRVVNVRRGLSRFYGTVHSYASLPHRSGGLAEFNVVTTPTKLKNVDASRVDRVVSVGQRLLGPIPYRGGDLELEVGLFSIRSADYAGPFLSVLEELSTLVGVSYVSTALSFAEPLKNGVNLLTGGGDDAILEVGVAVDYPRPQTGYSVVMRAPKDEVDVSRLRVTPSDYKLVDSRGEAVRDYPYMVLKVEAAGGRDDWFTIPDIQAAYGELQGQVRAGKFNEAEEALVVFKRVVLTSHDLLFADARRLYGEVEAQAQAVMGTTRTARGQASMPDLRDIPLFS